MTSGEYIEQQYGNNTLFTNLKEPLMITLDQAIELATKAHEGQWRKLQPTTIEEFNQINGSTKMSPISNKHFILDDNTNIYIENTDILDKPVIKGAVSRKPYITHPLAVMAMMSTEEEKIVAVLHDVFENNKTFELKCNIEDNRYINTPDSKTILISTYVGKALASLTNNLHLKYEEYINDIVLNKLATKVKIADIVCNLADNPSEYAKQKYLKALPILLKGI